MLPADLERAHPEFAHQMTRLTQGLSRVDVRRILFRCLARAGHRDPLMSLPRPKASLQSPSGRCRGLPAYM